MATLEQFNQFVKELEITDWYYDYSDDSRAYRRGKDQVEAMWIKSRTDPVYQNAYNIWHEHLAKKIDKAACDEQLNKLREQLT